MGKVGNRISRIKQIPFPDALERVSPGIEQPRRIPGAICCPLPDHQDNTPSFSVQSHRFHCYGCHRGGDIVDFVQVYYDVNLKTALARVEAALGFGDTDGDELSSLIAQIKTAFHLDTSELQNRWRSEIRAITDRFLERMLPFLRIADQVVLGIAEGRVDYVLAELHEAAIRVPLTERRFRAELRELRAWSGSWGDGVERDVERATGMDRLDCTVRSGIYKGGVPVAWTQAEREALETLLKMALSKNTGEGDRGSRKGRGKARAENEF